MKVINKKINLPYWINARKTVFLHIILESLIFILVFNFFNQGYFIIESKIILNLIFLNSIWITLSYLTGRYCETVKEYKKTRFYVVLRSILNLFLSIIFTGIIFVFINNSIVFIKLTWLEFYSFKKFLILFSLICFVNELIMNKLFYKKNNLKINRWLFLVSKNLEAKINQIISIDTKNIKFKNIEDINEIVKLKENFSGIVVENLFHQDFNLQNELNKININTPVFSIMEWCEMQFQRYPPDLIKESDLFSIHLTIEKNLFQLRIKRFFDFFASILLLLIALPIIIVCCILIKINDGGPVFYTQIRSGIKGRPFKILKLRTMKIDAEKKGVQWAKANDKRITQIGKILRKFRLDELPQLINVISGELSLIGPRPERPEIDKEIKNKISHYQLRNIIKPGLSGWAQVNYNYGASIKDAENKLSYDLFYIKNFNLILDLLIAIKTIKLISNASGSEPSKLK